MTILKFNLLFLGRASPSIPKKSKLPPRPDDYDDYWYQDDETGEWRNEYDDEGKERLLQYLITSKLIQNISNIGLAYLT